MKVIVAISSSKDPIYDKFKDIWVKCINYIKTTDLGNNYDFYFVYNEETKDDINFSLDVYPNYTDYYYKYRSFETELISIQVVILNKIINFYKYIREKLNLDDNTSYNHNTLTNTTYVLRTNLSSLFDFVKLFDFLLDQPKKCFIAGTINGFYNNVYTTISGMNTIISLDVLMYVVCNLEGIMDYLKLLRYEDDTISNYIIKNLNVYLINIKRLDFIEMEKVVNGSLNIWPATPKSIIYQKCKIKDDTIFSFRFKTFDRENDVKVMNMLNDKIYSKGFDLNNFVENSSKSLGYIINTELESYGDLYSKYTSQIDDLTITEELKLTIKSDLSVEIYSFTNKTTTNSNLTKCIEQYYKVDQIKINCVVRPDRFKLFTEDTNIKMTNLLDPDIDNVLDYEFFEAQICVPFRARGKDEFRRKQLFRFIGHMKNYMKTLHSNIKYRLVIIEQNNDRPFNRGFLLNIGFKECEKHVNSYIKYYIHHNCDLFPEIISKQTLDYSYPGLGVRDIFGYSNGLGGISIINRNSFNNINGFPNNCIGWSTEDEIIKQRCQRNNIQISRPIYNQYVYEENHSRDSSFQHLNKLNTSDDNVNWHKNGLTSTIYDCIINTQSEFKVDDTNILHYLVDFNI